jgi:hypothetical protein
MTEPDLVAADVHVYRTWYLQPGLDVLFGPYYGTWEKVEAEATCHSPYWREPHESPAPLDQPEHCRCGLYGFYDPADAFGYDGNAVGVVQVTGRTVLATRGLRAQRMRILALAPLAAAMELEFTDFGGVTYRVDRGEAPIRRFAQRLGVPFYDRFADLVTDYPPQDFSSLWTGPVGTSVQQTMQDLRQAHLNHVISLGKALTDAGFAPEQPPTDAKERALWLRQHRNTGPSRKVTEERRKRG